MHLSKAGEPGCFEIDADASQYFSFPYSRPSMGSYRYDPIDFDGCAFRLLRLCSGSDAPIQCDLFDARLDELIEYEALSYTWGDSERPIKIIIDGNPMLVTMNLFEALWDIRYPSKDRILWIDAICINQDDMKERGHQVKHMASIYKSAERVVVWLGQPSLDIRSVFRRMRQLEKIANEHAYHEWQLSDQRWQKLWSKVDPILHHDDVVDWLPQQRRGLQSILNHSWFTRVWIIQEIANARSATIVCGTATVSSRIFAAMPSILGIELDPHCQAIFDVMPGPLRKHSWWSQQRDLRTLMIKFRWSKASDQRDAVYALLGMSSDASKPELLLPNYELPVGDVVRHTLAFLISIKDQHISAASLPQWTLPDLMWSLETLESRVLQWSAESGHVALASHLLDLENSSSGRWEPEGDKLALCAARNGHTSIARLLHDTGRFNINARDKYGGSFMYGVAMKRDVQLLHVLLDTDRVEVNAKDSLGGTLFAIAVHSNLFDGVELLLRKGADPNTPRTRTPALIQSAINYNNATMIKMLLRVLDIDALRTSTCTLMQSAIDKNNAEIVGMLLEVLDIDALRTSTSTLMQSAISIYNVAVIKLLREVLDTDIATRMVQQHYLLQVARFGYSIATKQQFEFPKADINAKDEFGQTPIIIATRYGHEEVVKDLIDTGKVDFTAVSWPEGMTPFTLALYLDKREIMEVMLKSGRLDLFKNGCHGCTQLVLAIQHNLDELVRRLLDMHNIDVNEGDDDERSPLSHAAEGGKVLYIHGLLSTGKVDVDKKDRNGRTALHWAAQKGNVRTTEVLLNEGGANADIEDESGQTALDSARGWSRWQVVDVLESHCMLKRSQGK
jgi:ankyrin repeat protein